jgi:hypothetical protein
LVPQSGHCAAIQESGMVPTGAGMFSLHFLQRIVKSQCRVCGRLNTNASIGEQKAKLQCGFPQIKSRTSDREESIRSFHVVYAAAENPIIRLGQALGSAARTISTSTLRASSGFWTSRRKLMRVPFMPSAVFSRRWNPSRSTAVIVASVASRPA